jgi:hypothetical protein
MIYSTASISVGILLLTILILRKNGRVWTKGDTYFLEPSANSPSTSQALLDPYSLSHVLHGFAFYALFHRLSPESNFLASLALESAWEVVENSSFIINKYRANTASLDYYGDSILNTVGDLMSMVVGWFMAKHLPVRSSIAVFLAIELLMLGVWKDNLSLNVIMLLYPIDAIKMWQLKAMK